jgi:hypothetical protein
MVEAQLESPDEAGDQKSGDGERISPPFDEIGFP